MNLLIMNKRQPKNVLKSDTLLSSAPERHSKNQEQRKSATPFLSKGAMKELHSYSWGERKYERPSLLKNIVHYYVHKYYIVW